MEKDRILAIEDDEGVCRLLRHSLAREDYEVRIAHSGEDGLAAALEDPPGLLLLDLELPGMDGLDVCQKLKEDSSTRSIPIIILSGKGEESDVVQGLEMGADDYIVKPFSPKILNARVQAVLRRRSQVETRPGGAESFEFGALHVDTRSSTIKVAGADVDLSPPEYHFALLLICFLSNHEERAGCPVFVSGENPVSVIGMEGMALYSENRLGRLLPIFRALAENDEAEAAVLSAFYGFALFDTNPELGHRFLVDAEQKLQVEGDPRAELVVLSFLVFYHIVFDGDARSASRYLSRAELLCKVVFDKLAVYSRVAVAQNLALGRSFLLNDIDGSNEYLLIAEALAEDRGLVNLVVLNRLIRISESFVMGDQETMLEGLEECLRFVNHPQVSNLHKSMLKTLQLKCFAQRGLFRYVQLQLGNLGNGPGSPAGQDSIAASQLEVCRLETLYFFGFCEELYQLCCESLQRTRMAENDLVRPFLNGFKAISAALSGEREVALEAVAACRSETGPSAYRRAFSELLCARALMQLGEETEASVVLAGVQSLLDDNDWRYLKLQHKALTLLLQNRSATAVSGTIEELLTEMQERNIWHLQALTGEDYHQLYHLARENGRVESSARLLLRKRLHQDVTDEGEVFPILTISTLGGLRLFLDGKLIARTEDFSRTQRECLALLSASTGYRVPQEEVQLTFWPDKSPEKARSTLDTMLSRLRRILKDKLQPHPVKRYLKMLKGVLTLEGTVVDAVDVAKGIGRAREHVRRREFLQADAAFAVALSRWHGQFMPGSCSADQAAAFSSHLQQLCLDASIEWSELLNESGQTRQSIEVLTHALNMDRCNEVIMKSLYRSQMRDGNIAAANQLLVQFEKVMASEGYSPSGIARILASFKSSE